MVVFKSFYYHTHLLANCQASIKRTNRYDVPVRSALRREIYTGYFEIRSRIVTESGFASYVNDGAIPFTVSVTVVTFSGVLKLFSASFVPARIVAVPSDARPVIPFRFICTCFTLSSMFMSLMMM